MTIGDELEQLVRRIVREEFAVRGAAPAPDDDAELRELAIERAAKLRRAQGGR